jgi:hypothetical protein
LSKSGARAGEETPKRIDDIKINVIIKNNFKKLRKFYISVIPLLN